VARELHDELAQSLTALKMDTIWLRDHLAQAPQDVQAKLAGMLAMLDASVAATRRIAADLRPLVLDDLGLVAGHRMAGAELHPALRRGLPTDRGRRPGAARTLCHGGVSHCAGVAGQRGQTCRCHARCR
jgi:signal transduction histidine kinase